MKRPTLLVIISLTILLCQLTPQLFAAVVWSDEFDGPTIDKSIWTHDVGGHGFGNGQFEFNTALSQNSYIDSGDLVIKAIRENYEGNEFTSARMLTQGRFAFKYGTLEARIQFPDTENGLWPAFWMLGNNFPGIPWPDAGEIDIVEMGSAAGITEGLQQEKINSAIHYSNALGDYEYAASWIDAAVDLSLDYHLYKLEWTPTDMTFYLDGVQYATWDITPAYFAEFHQPHFPIINLAIGGYDPSYTGVYSPAGVTALPSMGSTAEIRVDWIRLSDNAFTEVFLGADIAETGTFGVYTETTPVDAILVYGDDTDPGWPYSDEAAIYPWEGTMTDAAVPATPSEGAECWTFDVGAVAWFGMGVFLPNYRNMTNYSDGYLNFDIQSTLTDTMKVGLQSSRGGQFWLPLGDETSEFGFARDGNWHSISVPLNRFANTDFKTIHQIFMLMADTVSASTTVAIDNVYWEESVARPTPANGNFGVYTETAANKDAGEFALGVDGDFFVWENTLDPAAQTPYEGSECMSFTSAAGQTWFGVAFTPNVKHNLTAFRYPESKLHFAMKTSSSTTFKVGMKSGNVDGVGQKWITFAAGSDPYGFARDGNWHVIDIPMSDIINEVDLFEVSQLFQILGTTGPIADIQFDDVAFTGGGDPLSVPGGGNIPPTVSITSPANGTFYDPGDDVTITAEANDVNGTITKVEFFDGASLLAEDACSPYSYTWNSIPAGTYNFTARATDNNDVSRSSSTVTIYVGTPVLTSIDVTPSSTTIAEGTYTQFTATGLDQFSLPISANANWSVSGGGVIDENGYFAAIDAGGPYTVTAQDGAISDTANVTVNGEGLISDYDASGKVDMLDYTDLAWFWTANDCDGGNNFCDGADHVQDGDVDFYDAQIFMLSWLKSIAPTVTITSPAGGAIFTPGDNVTINATATVNVAGTTITTVEFYEGANYLGQDTTAPYSYTWNSIPQGAYSITAIATDDLGQSSTSAPITISAATASIVNGGFESGTAGWTINNLGGNSTVISTTESPRTGSYSAKLVTDSTGAGVRAEMLQTVAGLSGSTSYDFELYVKGLMGVGGVAWAEIKWFNASSGYLGSSGLINLWAGLSNSTYGLRGGTYVTPVGTASAEISIRVEGGAMVATNTMFVDDVSFSN